jgi:23S rRNA pseudouridine1911/1915/1917 synthase
LDILRLSIPIGKSGERLDQFITEATCMSRTHVQRLINAGAVKVDGLPTTKNHKLRCGENVEIEHLEPQQAEPAPQEIPITIVYQDDDLVIVSKPAGMVVHPAAGHSDGTLVNALLYSIDGLSGIGGELRPGIVHRLDRDTSGLMVVAKNDRSHAGLQKMIQKRELKRLYLALVYGLPETRLGTINAPVGRDPRDRKKMAVINKRGRPALTNFRVIETFKGAALLEVELVTGRTHQIRVHLSYIGHPVVGDPEYGVIGVLERELGLSRQFLHAYKLSFLHPITGESLDFQDPLPDDLDNALRRLRELG